MLPKGPLASRYAMIRRARLSPMPGSVSSSSAVAVFEIHRREVRGDLLPGDLRLCLDDYARDAILPIPKRQARQGAQEHRRQPQQNDLTFCRPSPSTHC